MTASPIIKTLQLRLAHSPDSDDAFMFYALATGKIPTPGLKFTHVLKDIETLNQAALKEEYDITAVSFYAFPFLADKYVLLDCGASFGEGYGPIIVAARPMKRDELAGKRVAVAGLRTTSYLALKLFEPGVETVVVPFDHILEAVQNHEADAGVIIHEAQLLYPEMGLSKVADLGQWWQEETKLPLPLGGNAIRRSLGAEIGLRVAGIVRQSVEYGLEHREEALNYAMQFARDMDSDTADKFVGMYVNSRTLAYGEDGRRAVRELYSRGAAAGLLPRDARVDFLAEDQAA
jgi:1,4-dihydroxy-6-naphthoate synthase